MIKILARKRSSFFSEGASRDRLFVILHGWTYDAGRMQSIADLVRERDTSGDIFVPTMPINCVYCREDGASLARQLLEEIECLDSARREAGAPYREIILIGHSSGAVLCRAIWALAVGGQPGGTVDHDGASVVADRIVRMVLIAAVARGWTDTMPVSVSVRLLLWFGMVNEVLFGERFFVFDLRRGSPFLTTMRLQTLAVLHSRLRTPPLTIQLLGTNDDLVAPGDDIDVTTGESFIYCEMRDTGHFNANEVGGDDPVSAERRRLCASAIFDDEASLRRVGLSASAVGEIAQSAVEESFGGEDAEAAEITSPRAAEQAAESVQNVTLVVHGIRDFGFWTKKLAIRIRGYAARRGTVCRTLTPSYGFLPMGPFLIPTVRRRYACWLMDHYVTVRAAFPQAREICFIGHSNGTYLLAKALKDCRAIHFDRVIFAGSVVRHDYPWENVLRGTGTGQIGRLVNYVATDDWVVASVPRALQRMGLANLGDAGHSGFRPNPNIVEARYVPGDHSAAIREENWEEMAAFVVDGIDPPSIAPSPRRAHDHGTIGKRTAYLGLFGSALLASVFLLPLGLLASFGIPDALWVLVVLGIFWGMGRVLTQI
ncbi:MAG: alpha/beta fold hydrolase [Pseudomonadota bacterium]